MSEGDSLDKIENPDRRMQLPWKRRKIPHYYGDHVRELFIATAVLSVVAIPLWGDLLPFGSTTQIGLALLLVLLAGLTHPKSRILMFYNVPVSGFGILFLEATAIAQYANQSFELFLAREVCVLLLLFAFYFSVKTMRAMLLGIVRTGREE